MSRMLEQLASGAVLCEAWRRVRKGKADKSWMRGTRVRDIESAYAIHLETLSDDLLNGDYRPEPVHCFGVRKANGATRSICAFTARDMVAQRAALIVLEPLGEWIFHPDSFGYRPMCSIDMVLSRIQECVRAGYCWIGETDIVQCFDRIAHWRLFDLLQILSGDDRVVRLIEQWVHAIPPRWRPVGPGCGLPQGMVLSPFLCNLFLHEMDMALDEYGIPFVRYADNFAVLARSPQLARQALDIAATSLSQLELVLHPQKTRIVRSSSGHRFLGRRLPNPRRGDVA